MSLTAEEQAKAAAIVATWMWQPAEGHNYRFEHSTRTITRFYEAASMQPDEIRLVIAYLRTQDLGTDGVSLLNRTIDFGAGWKSQDAWYQTIPSEKWANTDSTKIRIYQVLYNSAGNAGDGPYLLENGCQYKVSHTFYWDVDSMPGVPASESGISWTLQGMTRNKENGLYSCVLEKRERVQQDVAEYGTERTVFAQKDEEFHLGVRQNNVASTGKSASVSRGKVIRRRITKNADCTSDVHNETVTDVPTPNAIVERRKTLRGTVTRNVDRNQLQPLDGSNMSVGEMRRSEQTESNLWNNERQVSQGEAGGTLSESCEDSSGTHTDVTTENVVNKPSVQHQSARVNESVRKEARRTEENTWDVSTTRIVYVPRNTGRMLHGSPYVQTRTVVGVNQPSVPISGIGQQNQVRRISASPNEHGSFSTTEEIVDYKPQRQVFRSGTPNALIETTVGRNQLAPIEAVGAVNEDVQISQSPNDHGSYDYQQRKIVYRPMLDRTNAGTTNARVSTEIARNATALPTTPVRVNEDVQISANRNEHGSIDYTTRKTQYVPSECTTQGGSVMHQETVTSGLHQTTVPTTTPQVNVRDEVAISLNDHGSMSTQRRRIVYQPSKTSEVWTDENFTYKLTQYRNQLRPIVASAYKGVVSNSFSQNDHGSYDGSSILRVSKANGSVTTLMFHYGPVQCSSKILYMKGAHLYKRTVTANCERFYGQLRAIQKKVAGGENCTMAGFVSGCHASGVDMAHGVLYTNITLGPESKVAN